MSLACSGGAGPEHELQRSQLDLTAQDPSCDELLARFKSNLLAQMATRAEEARINPYLPVGFGAPVPAARGAALPPLPAQPLPAQPVQAAVSPPFSATTQLVPGVDPSDLIKTEGDRIYLVHDRSLLLLDASDPSDTRLIATVPLGDGYPSELLVHEGRVVVFSNLYEGLAESTSPLDPFLYPSTFAKLTLVDAADASPRVTREWYFEGNYYQAGRSGSIARSFVQQGAGGGLDYPPVSYVDIFGDPRSPEDIDRQIAVWVELTTETIEEATIEDFLPEQYERVAGQLVPVPVSCSSLLLSASDSGQIGSSAVVSIDLAAAEPSPASTPLFGFYAQLATLSENVAVLFEQTYGANPVQAEPQAVFHAVEFDGVQGSYAGSVSTAGYLGGVIGVDEASGVIGAVLQRDIYDSEQGYLGSESRLQTFELREGLLSALGESAALPGDYAEARLFGGTRAYISSYVDSGTQLIVADLSDPGAPAVAGSLSFENASYTSSLVPLGSGRLLTVTQGYDAVTFASDYVLQVLDVSDPSAPAPEAQLSLGQDAYSEALYDPRAVTLHPEQSVFSLPVQSFTDGSSAVEVFRLSEGGLTRLGRVRHEHGEPTLLECLALMGYPSDLDFVDSLDEDLIELLQRDCSYYRFGTARRGLFRGDDVFALSSAALTVHPLDALAGPPLSSIELPLPERTPGVPVPIEVVVAPSPESEPAAEE